MTSASRLTGWPSSYDAYKSSYAVSLVFHRHRSGETSYFFKSTVFFWVLFDLLVDKLELNTAIDTFDAHGLRAQNDKVIDIPDMVTVLRSLYEVVVTAYPGEIRLPLVIDLCLNWILNVYDRYQF